MADFETHFSIDRDAQLQRDQMLDLQVKQVSLLETSIKEMRFIRWLLFAVLIMMVTFAVHLLPKGWWYTPWMWT